MKNNIGQTIKRYRRKAGYTQEEFAEQCGLSRTGISDIERGIYNPSISTLQDIAKALNLDISKIFVPDFQHD